jgi:xylan 1,4-beta-xylosidase
LIFLQGISKKPELVQRRFKNIFIILHTNPAAKTASNNIYMQLFRLQNNKVYILILLAVVFNSCSSKTISPQQQLNAGEEYIYMADPTIFYDKGTYYLYGTGGLQYNEGFAVYFSKDLKTWKGPAGKKNGYALQKGDAFGTNQFWAPQVLKYNNRVYITYAANEHIGMAASDSPLGPFSSTILKPIAEETKQIDPFIFIDSNGKKYMYYVVVANGGNRIYVAEMNSDMLSQKKETATLCIEADAQWENTGKDKWSVTEGPTIIKHKSLYYIIYSANDFRSIDYAVGYATSTTPMGPWKKYEGNPIIHRSVTGQKGSGHGDVVKGRNGQLFYVFHTHNSTEKVVPRKTAIITIKFAADEKTGIDKLVADGASFRFLRQAK